MELEPQKKILQELVDDFKARYESFGWKVFFIDENDLNDKKWEERCLNILIFKK